LLVRRASIKKAPSIWLSSALPSSAKGIYAFFGKMKAISCIFIYYATS
jgi:hypothetical protein